MTTPTVISGHIVTSADGGPPDLPEEFPRGEFLAIDTPHFTLRIRHAECSEHDLGAFCWIVLHKAVGIPTPIAVGYANTVALCARRGVGMMGVLETEEVN